MRSDNSSSSLAPARSSGSVQLSPNLALTLSLVDSSAEQLMVQKDFRAAFDTCENGLETLGNSVEPDDIRYGECKAALCILGIQALAELNQWRGVLAWLLQHYASPENMPAKIMQMCILLYTKVGQQVMMEEAGSIWLHSQSNWRLSGYRTVAELYLLHVLLPLGLTAEARELVLGEVGSVAFTEDQKQVALGIVENEESPVVGEGRPPSPVPVLSPGPVTPQATMIQKLEAMLRHFYRGLSVASAGAFPLRKMFLAVLLLYMLVVRMDPAQASSFPWISRLLQLLRQMYDAMFAPYYRTSTQNRGL